MESEGIIKRYLKRGNYNIKFYEATQEFYDNYMITSLPQIFLIDSDRILKHIITGQKSYQKLLEKIKKSFKL
jgi:hypothetical protein